MKWSKRFVLFTSSILLLISTYFYSVGLPKPILDNDMYSKGDLTWIVWLVISLCAFYAFALSVYKTHLTKRLTSALLFLALFMCSMQLFSYTNASTDYYRYIWQGRVSNAGQDNYKLKPWDAGTDAFNNELFDRMDWKDEKSVYPPLAEQYFRLPAAIFDSGVTKNLTFEKRLVTSKLPLLFLYFFSGYLLYKLSKQKIVGLLWLLCPYTQFEFLASAHIDIISITFVLGSLLALRNNSKATAFLAGILISSAGLVKLSPLLLVLPACAWIYVQRPKIHLLYYLTGSLLPIGLFIQTFTQNNFAYIHRVGEWSKGIEIQFANSFFLSAERLLGNNTAVVFKLVLTLLLLIICSQACKKIRSSTYTDADMLLDSTKLSFLPLLFLPAVLQWYLICPLVLFTLYSIRSKTLNSRYLILISTTLLILSVQYIDVLYKIYSINARALTLSITSSILIVMWLSVFLLTKKSIVVDKR